MRDLTRDLLHVARLWRKIARAVAARHGVSEAASAPLIWIDRLGDNVRQTGLAGAIGIEGASLVRLIDELQASGLVNRSPDPADRRANAISLTPRGREVVKEVTGALNALRLDVFAKVSADDVHATFRVLDAIKIAAGEAPVTDAPTQAT